jgi:uncharacterized membrane protein
MSNKKKWYKQKTTWTGIAAIITAVVGYATHTLPLAMALQTVMTGLIGIFLRQGVEGLK